MQKLYFFTMHEKLCVVNNFQFRRHRYFLNILAKWSRVYTCPFRYLKKNQVRPNVKAK